MNNIDHLATVQYSAALHQHTPMMLVPQHAYVCCYTKQLPRNSLRNMSNKELKAFT